MSRVQEHLTEGKLIGKTREVVIQSKTYGTKKVLIDEEDWDQIYSLGAWYIRKLGSDYNPKWYAEKKLTPVQAKRVKEQYPDIHIAKSGSMMMHQLIMMTQKGQDVDHINHNGLDNRRENLRMCTRSENAQNKRLREDSRSGYKGVYERPKKQQQRKKYVHTKRGKPTGKISYHTHIPKKRFEAYIRKPNSPRTTRLGHYETAEEAAKAYDKAAKEFFGEFAYFNFPR
jgi:hypothetical protein